MQAICKFHAKVQLGPNSDRDKLNCHCCNGTQLNILKVVVKLCTNKSHPDLDVRFIISSD